MEPKILVLDEPTAFLDPHSKKHLLDKLRQLSLAKIVISHDLEFMLQLCEKSIIISAGRNLAEGKPELVFRNAELMEQSHLEVPRSLS